MLTTFNLVGYINEIELSNLNVVFRQYATELHILIHLICRIACALFHAMPSLNRTCIILGCASCHAYVMFVYYVVCFFPVSLLWVGSDNVVLWGFVRLRPFVLFMDSFFFLAGSQARWPYPRNHFCLRLLVVRSIAMSRYLPLIYQASQIAMIASNLFTLPSKPLFGYVTALLSPSYSVVSCRWIWRLLHVEHGYVGISHYLLFN